MQDADYDLFQQMEHVGFGPHSTLVDSPNDTVYLLTKTVSVRGQIKIQKIRLSRIVIIYVL